MPKLRGLQLSGTSLALRVVSGVVFGGLALVVFYYLPADLGGLLSAMALAGDGHEVTYLTLRQWERGTRPAVPGVDIRAVGPRFALYTKPGRRRRAAAR